MTETKIFLNSGSLKRIGELELLMAKIREKDATFDWHIEGRFLIIRSPDRNKAFKRGAWLCGGKVDILKNHHYKIIDENPKEVPELQ